MSIHINVTGLDEMIDALHDISRTGIPRAMAQLDDALDRTAEVSRELAHQHEGDLKASQTHSSEHRGQWWQGSINYSARGAAFEIQRGGDHAQFIDSLAGLTEAEFLRAVMAVGDDL